MIGGRTLAISFSRYNNPMLFVRCRDNNIASEYRNKNYLLQITIFRLITYSGRFLITIIATFVTFFQTELVVF